MKKDTKNQTIKLTPGMRPLKMLILSTNSDKKNRKKQSVWLFVYLFRYVYVLLLIYCFNGQSVISFIYCLYCLFILCVYIVYILFIWVIKNIVIRVRRLLRAYSIAAYPV